MANLTELVAELSLANGSVNATALGEKVIAANTSLDTFFVLVSGYMVFLMQAGFAMLTAGSVRTKNVKNVLMKNVLDACVGAIAYYLFGWAFAYGNTEDAPFIGYSQFALSAGWDSDFTSFFFQWAFAATAATIVSGSVAERTSFYAYLGYAFLLTSFVYPVVSHWVWGGGFLSNIFDIGMIDFAGCSVVHMVGGVAGLVGAIMVGPRTGRFDSDGNVVPMPGHSATLCTLGTFLLWFGWFGFNPGSALGISGDAYKVVSRCAVTTTLGGAAGGLTTLVIRKVTDHIFDLLAVLNGALAGLVSVTACCAFIEPWSAVLIGFVGAIVYVAAVEMLLKLKIDDPLEAFPIHGAVGFWGVIAAGLFNRRGLQYIAGLQDQAGGLLFGGPNPGLLLGINVLGAVLIALWTAVLIGIFFFAMKSANLLRVGIDEEMVGLDISKHGSANAYAFVDRMEDGTGAMMEDNIEGVTEDASR